MAVNTTENEPHLLHAATAQAGGIVAMAMGAAAAAGAILLLARWGTWIGGESGTAAVAALFAAAGMLGVLGAHLLAGRTWAQPALLAVVGLLLVGAVTYIVREFIWPPAERVWWSYAVMAGTLAVSACAMAVLWGASAPNSRLRYGSNVIVATALAVAFLLVVNLIAHGPGNFARVDLQLLGQYGLSERSKKVLKAVPEPVRITILYSLSEANQAQRGDRVEELVQEIHDLSPRRITAARVRSEGERAAVLARVAQQARDRAPAHVRLLRQFLAESPAMLKALGDRQIQWRQLQGGSYLDLWGGAAQVTDLFRSIHQAHEDLSLRLSKDLSGTPDYAKLADEIRDLCSQGQAVFAALEQMLKTRSKIPGAVAAHQSAAFAKLDEVRAALQEALGALRGSAGASGGASRPATAASQPAGPDVLLRRFIAAMEKAVQKTQDATKALDEVGGTENAGTLRESSAWLVETPIDVGGMTMLARSDLTRSWMQVAQFLAFRGTIAQSFLEAGNPEAKAKALEGLQEQLVEAGQTLDRLTLTSKRAVASLAAVDDGTAAIFKQVAEGNYLQGLLAPYTRFAEDADNLPPLPPGTLAEDLAKDNVVLVETADQTEVIPFDQVWPLRARQREADQPATPDDRVFNGDSAIASKVLAMTQKPIATVILTYLGSRMGPYGPQEEPGMTPDDLGELQNRLRQSNLRVKTWDLAASPEPVDVDDPNEPSLLKVLLVLPPKSRAEPGGPLDVSQEHRDCVKRLLDSNEVAGALFLANWEQPASQAYQRQYLLRSRRPLPPATYAWNDYLASDWGIRVLFEHVVIPAEPDDTGSRLRLVFPTPMWLPLRTFTDHPVGRPLQGQRVFWYFPCPVAAEAHKPRGVTVASLLSVPAFWQNTWASSNALRIMQQMRDPGSFISPDYEQGDLRTPFDLAVAAARQGDPNAAPARVIVMGLAESLVDSYLSQPVQVVKEKNQTASEDPPKANPDVVVNGIYWLCGRDNLIAAGPVSVQPIRSIRATTYNVLWGLCVVGLPALVLGAGGLVLVLRRR